MTTGATSKRDRARAAAIGASAALHAVVLAWLAVSVPLRPPPRIEDRAPLLVELVRPEPLRVGPAAAPRAAVAPPVAERIPLAPARVAPAPLRSAPVPPSPLAALTAPAAPPATARGPGGEPATARRPSPAPLPGDEPSGDVRGFLRATVGCSHDEYLKLTVSERAGCDRGFAAAAKAGPLALPTDKLAAYSAQAEANERKRGRRDGPLVNTLPACDPAMVGSNLLGSCLPKEAMHTVARF